MRSLALDKKNYRDQLENFGPGPGPSKKQNFSPGPGLGLAGTGTTLQIPNPTTNTKFSQVSQKFNLMILFSTYRNPIFVIPAIDPLELHLLFSCATFNWDYQVPC